MPHNTFNTKKTVWVLLLGTLIIASFFRLYHITNVPPGLYPDEAMNGNNAVHALETGDYKVFYPENNGREGLFANIQAFFLWVYGVHEPWVLRLPSAIFGILTVLGIFLLTRELFALNAQRSTRNDADKAEFIALLSSFLLATSFWHINFSRIGFRAIMAPALLTFALFFFLKAFNVRRKSQTPSTPDAKRVGADKLQTNSKFEYNHKTHRHSEELATKNLTVANTDGILRKLRMTAVWNLSPFGRCPAGTEFGVWGLAAISGLLLGLGAHSYIAYRIMPLLFLGFVPFYWNGKRFWKVLGVTVVFSLIAASPLLLYFVQNPGDFLGRTSQISIFDAQNPLRALMVNTVKTIGMFFVAGDYNWRHNLAGAPQLYWPVAILFALGAIIGIVKLWQNIQFSWKKLLKLDKKIRAKTLPYILLFGWLALATAPVVISSEGIPHALRAILMIPPVMILAGVGGWYLWRWVALFSPKTWRPIVAGLVLILAILPLHTFQAYFIEWGGSANTRAAFNANYVQLGRTLNELPHSTPKYVLVNAGGVAVPVQDAWTGKEKHVPMPAQTVMFITNTFLPQGQLAKNIHYVLPSENVPGDVVVFPLE